MDSDSRKGFLDRLRGILGLTRHSTSEELEREIAGLVDQGEAQGLISPHEGEMIEAVLELAETTAGQIMVPRIDVATVPDKATIPETIKVIIDSGHSRIPVHGADMDHITGVIHAKDLLSFWGDCPVQANIEEIARKPFFVPQSMSVDHLMSEFRRRRQHMAIVVDEYGGTAGIVTMEDVLEEIVGDIVDEYDDEPLQIQEHPDGCFMVDAKLEVEELAETMSLELPNELPEGRFETVGGLITTILGRVPTAGEVVEFGPIRMTIKAADERRVTTVFVEPRESDEAAANGD